MEYERKQKCRGGTGSIARLVEGQQPLDCGYESHYQPANGVLSRYVPLASPSLQIGNVTSDDRSKNGGPNQWIIRVEIFGQGKSIYTLDGDTNMKHWLFGG